MKPEFIQQLARPAETKIVMLVIDGIGESPQQPGGPTALEAAHTPNLDNLAAQGACGLQQPLGAGVVPGRAPAHLALLGYDATKYRIGRGVLAALGIGFDLTDQDMASTGKFSAINSEGEIIDLEHFTGPQTSTALYTLLRQIDLPGVELFIEPVTDPAWAQQSFPVVILRNAGGLQDKDHPSDMPAEGTSAGDQELPPSTQSSLPIESHIWHAAYEFTAQAKKILGEQNPPQTLQLEGFAGKPDLPPLESIFRLKAAAITTDLLCRGLARLAGIQLLEIRDRVAEEFTVLRKHWADFDFFYLHLAQREGNQTKDDFGRNVALIEEADAQLPSLLELAPDTIIVTGNLAMSPERQVDAMPSLPVALWSRDRLNDNVTQFGERACAAGALGPRIPAQELMQMALAEAGRLEKFVT